MMITTELTNLVLRQMTTIEDDKIFFYFQSQNQAHITKYGNTVCKTLEAATRFRLLPNVLLFGIELDEKLIGTIHSVQREDSLELGISLAKAATGCGYATISMRAAAKFFSYQFNRVYAEVEVTNQASLKMCQRAGFALRPTTVHRNWGHAVVFEFPQCSNIAQSADRNHYDQKYLPSKNSVRGGT